MALNNLPLDCVIRKGGTLFDCDQRSDEEQKVNQKNKALTKKDLTVATRAEINAGFNWQACVE